jgi:hypothetical protein
MKNKQKALAKHLIENESYSAREAIKFVKDSDFENGYDWLVLTDEEADEKTKEYIQDSVWAFNASFILGECGLDQSGADSLKKMQRDSCESANAFILSLIEKTCGLDSFVDSAISADGRGHFLSGYDGEENEQYINGEYYFIYKN